MATEHDINLVTDQCSTVIAENKRVTIGTSKASITPATMQAMVGIKNGTALRVHPNVTATISALTSEASANTALSAQASSVLSKLTSAQSDLLPSGNHASFGQTLQMAQGHCNDAKDLQQAQDFLIDKDYPDFGSGINNMSSMADRGLTNQLGDLNAAGKAMSSTGSMFNGISVDKIGTPGGMVESLNKNKLGNASGVNAKLLSSGVDLNDLHNPIYSDKISQSLSSIDDPTTVNVVAEQYGINSTFKDIPAATGSDLSLYTGASNLVGGQY